ncbi:Nitroreductase [Phytophthora cactorum]|nr:Nitroreductase [Phytophthora cactorum]
MMYPVKSRVPQPRRQAPLQGGECPSKDHGNGFCVSSVSFVKSSVSGVPSVAEWHVQAGVSSVCARVPHSQPESNLHVQVFPLLMHCVCFPRDTQRSPSGFNTQSWVCIVLRTTEDRAALANAMIDANVRKVNEAPVVVVSSLPTAPSKNVPRMQQLNRDNGAPDDFVNRIPALVEMFSGEHDPKVSTEAWAYKQATFAAATFLYAAQVHGLATCPMEGFDQAGVKKVLNIPDRYSIPVVVALGHANPAAKPAKPSVRFPPTEVFFDGKFGQSTEELFAEKLGATIEERYACKAFLPTPVPDETLKEILRLTLRAPTGFNVQPYACVLVREQKDREKLAEAMMDSNIRKVKEAPVVAVFAADLEPSKRDVRCATFLYAAQAHGLATCPMEGFDQIRVRNALDIPDRYGVPVVIALGHANPDALPEKPSVRLDPTEIFFDGKFGGSSEKIFSDK